MSKKQKILVVTGTRPDAIKMAPLVKALKSDERYTVDVLSTGQHKEMLAQVLDWFGIKPDYVMDVMQPGQPLSHLAGKLLSGVSDIVAEVQPDIVMVHGDVTTSAVAALATYYNCQPQTKKHIKIAHIEAGLRTHDMFSPYPEEGNRKMIAAFADYHFAPTNTAAQALLKEGVSAENVFVVGNTVIDALVETRDRMRQKGLCPLSFIPEDEKVILVTGHRRESYGKGFESICCALMKIAAKYPHMHIVYPVHLNPQVKGLVEKMLGSVPNIHLLPPMDYPNFVAAMMRAHLILTDSGGIQEEAPSLGKPTLVMRNVTERPEAVLAGTVKVIGTFEDDIVGHVSQLLDNEALYQKMADAVNPYGDGKSTERILNLMAGGSVSENTFRI